MTVTGNAARVTLHLDAGAVVAKQIFLGWSKVPRAALPEMFVQKVAQGKGSGATWISWATP